MSIETLKLGATKEGIEKRKTVLRAAAEILVFIIGGLALWETGYNLCNIIGAAVSGTPSQGIIELKRTLPLMITTALLIYLGMRFFALNRSSENKRRKGLISSGIVTAVLGIAVSGYIVYGFASGIYTFGTLGNLTALFPLDFIIVGAAFAVIGIVMAACGAKTEKNSYEIPTDHGKISFFGWFFRTFYYMTAIYGFAAVRYSFILMDWTGGAVFFNIMVVICYALPPLFTLVYRFAFIPLCHTEKKKSSLLLGIVFLIISVISAVLYFTAVTVYNEAPCINALAILPIEHTASVNAFPILIILPGILASLTAVFKGIFARASSDINC